MKLHRRLGHIHGWLVAPRVGAWIETLRFNDTIANQLVAPRVGAWIETLAVVTPTVALTSRSPRGGVD